MRTRVKICGICRAEDAAEAVRAGADAIGIVFDPDSKRHVSIQFASQILTAVPPFVTTVGLFVNTPADEIREVLKTLPLSAVQLQGDEPPEAVADLKPIRVVKALHVSAKDDALIQKWREGIRELNLTNLIGVMLETPMASGPRGGTGVMNDFAGLAELQKAGGFEGLGPIIAAGGLRPENVGSVVQSLRPFAVDVSSGVESSVRQKSAEKIAAFVRAVRDADSHQS